MYPSTQDADAVLLRVSEFFEGESDVHKTAESLARRLREEGIDFALAGALALGAHGAVRATADVDVLIGREGLARFKERWLGRGYLELRPGGRPVRDTETHVRIDFLIAGDYPGDGRAKPVCFPDPKLAAVLSGSYPVISLPKLVELKLASGMSAPHRLQDLADVLRLVRVRSLPLELEQELDLSVRPKYRELWQAAQAPAEEY